MQRELVASSNRVDDRRPVLLRHQSLELGNSIMPSVFLYTFFGHDERVVHDRDSAKNLRRSIKDLTRVKLGTTANGRYGGKTGSSLSQHGLPLSAASGLPPGRAPTGEMRRFLPFAGAQSNGGKRPRSSRSTP